MQLNIEKNSFCKLEGIMGVKNHLEKLKDVSINDSHATGQIELSISYVNAENQECFKAISLDFDMNLDQLKILEIVPAKFEVYLVEGQGVEINYELVVNYLPKTEEPIEIELIPEEKIKDETKEDIYEQIKDDISDYYEDKLAQNIREDKVIETKVKDKASFLSFFDSKASYYKLKCLYVENEEELKDISKEYNVSMDKLLAGYDKQSHKVIFTIS